MYWAEINLAKGLLLITVITEGRWNDWPLQMLPQLLGWGRCSGQRRQAWHWLQLIAGLFLLLIQTGGQSPQGLVSHNSSHWYWLKVGLGGGGLWSPYCHRDQGQIYNQATKLLHSRPHVDYGHCLQALHGHSSMKNATKYRVKFSIDAVMVSVDAPLRLLYPIEGGIECTASEVFPFNHFELDCNVDDWL